MSDEYELFDNVDVPDADENSKKKNPAGKKSVIHGVSIITMFLVLAVCIVNLIMCLDLYSKYDEIHVNPVAYFQNDGYINTTETNNNIVVENAGDNIIVETTTVEQIVSYQQSSTAATSSNTINNVAVSTSNEQTVAQTTAAAVTSLVNINTATLEELTALNGIGEKKAEAIIEYRKENGKFRSVEELTNVSGIGEKTLENNIDKITVG